MSQIQLAHSKDKSPVYSEAVYAPEGLLTEWLAVVFACMTSSLLFYHMTRLKTLSMILAWPRSLLALLSVSVYCIIFSYYTIHGKRMDHQLAFTKDPTTRYQLNLLKVMFITLEE